MKPVRFSTIVELATVRTLSVGTQWNAPRDIGKKNEKLIKIEFPFCLGPLEFWSCWKKKKRKRLRWDRNNVLYKRIIDGQIAKTILHSCFFYRNSVYYKAVPEDFRIFYDFAKIYRFFFFLSTSGERDSEEPQTFSILIRIMIVDVLRWDYDF